MEISKMLTVSTAHISKETAELLENETKDLVVYKKENYGWFIHVLSLDWENDLEDYLNIPYDLKNILCFTINNGCEWLCLDRDGEIINDLNVYDW